MKIRNLHRQETDRRAEMNPSSNDVVVGTTLSLLSPPTFAVPENIKSHHLEINLAKFRDEAIGNFLGLGISAGNCKNSEASPEINASSDFSSIQAQTLIPGSEIDDFGGSSIQGGGIAQTLIPGSEIDDFGGSSIQARRIAQTLIPGSNQDQARISATKKRALDERAPESNKRLKWGDGFLSRFGGFGLETSQVFKRCGVLLGRLMKHKHSWVFNDPVDAKALGLPDYHDIVKHPMDLGTINNNLSLNRYKSPSDFAEDVRLVFRNAMAYNPEGQDVHVMAQQLSEVFEEQWAIITDSGSAPPAPKPVVTRRKVGRKPADEYPEPVNPPEELVQLVGPNITPVFVYRKQLVEWDTRKHQNRLFLNDREKLMDFMTEEERRAVEDYKKPGIDLIGIDRKGREFKLHSNKWGSLDIAVLNKGWHKIVVANRAKKGDWVHLWAYRRPAFCLFVDFREQP